jgi:hypothetical protein
VTLVVVEAVARPLSMMYTHTYNRAGVYTATAITNATPKLRKATARRE